jgi:hypothetical protein
MSQHNAMVGVQANSHSLWYWEGMVMTFKHSVHVIDGWPAPLYFLHQGSIELHLPLLNEKVQSTILGTMESVDLKCDSNRALVAHTCNPSYSGCRDQEDQGLKPAQANSSWDPISKNPSQK